MQGEELIKMFLLFKTSITILPKATMGAVNLPEDKPPPLKSA